MSEATASFGKALRAARLAKRWTQKEVAEYLGVSVVYVSDNELGRKHMTELHALALEAIWGEPLLEHLIASRGRATLVAQTSEQAELAAAITRKWVGAYVRGAP